MATTMAIPTETQPASAPANRGRWMARLPWSALLALADQATVSGTSFLVTLLLGRYATPEQLGLYTLGFTLLVLLVCAFDALITSPYTLYGNRCDEPERRILAGAALVHHFALTGIAVAFLAGVAGLSTALGQADLGRVLLVLAALAPLILLRELARRISFAEHRPGWAFAVDAAVSAIQIGLLLGLVFLARLTAISGHLATGIACAVAGCGWLWLWRGQFRIDRATLVPTAWRNWRFGRWVLGSQGIGVTHGFAVHWLLLFWSDPSATGAYAACLTVVLLSNPFLFGMVNHLGPVAARAYNRAGVAGVRGVVWKSLALFAVVMGGFSGTILLMAGPVLRLFYRDTYDGLEPVVRVLAVVVFVTGMGMAMDVGLRAQERADLSFRTSVVSLAVTVSAACLLIPFAGVPGAAWGYLLGTVAGTGLRGVLLLRCWREVTP